VVNQVVIERGVMVDVDLSASGLMAARAVKAVTGGPQDGGYPIEAGA
jgi:hypothetical protein